MKTKFLVLCFLSLLITLSIEAQITVSSILSNDMVLQRNADVKLWGKANPNEKLVISVSWDKQKVNTISNSKGEWIARIKTTEAGGPYSITISSVIHKLTLTNILLGEVWLCSGQSNMEMPIIGFNNQPINNSNDIIFDADNDNIRLFTVKKNTAATLQDSCKGKWAVASAESVAQFSAVGYLFAKQLKQKLKVPIGVISSNWGGTRIEPWMDSASISQYPESYLRATQEKVAANQHASYLYNGMIAPIANYFIKGVIWYQGESNISNYKEYASLMKGMVGGWRKNFGVGEFPFYYVQIAPYFYNDSKAINSALLRDAQTSALSLIPNSGMVSTIDIGEEKSIHPAEKYTVAKRLAFMALAQTYGIKGINYKTPTFKSITIRDSVAVINFNNVENGLCSFGKDIECFQISGEDKIFYPAQIKYGGKNELIISSPLVKIPVAVRYGFCNFPQTKGYLYNTAGLPVTSFRTDNWEK